MADVVLDLRQLADEIAVEEWDERLRTQAVVLAALRDGANKLEQLRDRVAAGPYCYACGRISLYAPAEAREELQATGLDTCSPRDCKAWAVHALYDHRLATGGTVPGPVAVMVGEPIRWGPAFSVPHGTAVEEAIEELLATPGKCRVCGCTDLHACDPPCSWADDDHTVCSACTKGWVDTDG